MNSFNCYGYNENNAFEAQTFEVTVSKNDKIISVTKDGSLMATVQLQIDKNKLSLLGKDGTEFSSVELPEISEIENAYYDAEKQSLILVVSSGETSTEIEIPFGDVLAKYAKKEDVEKNTQAIENEANIRAEADTKFEAKDIEIEASITNLDTRLTAKDSEIDESLANKVDWVDITTQENPNRKCIVLKNHDTILGTDTSGKTCSIIMVNKWDVVDLGTTKLPINLNTPKDVRPTVQEEGQTGEEAHKIAYVEDIQHGIYSLGEVGSFDNLDEAASVKEICCNQDNVILTFKITTSETNKESGFIVNTIYGSKISQALYWKQSIKPEMFRTITIQENGEVDNPPFYPYDDTQSLYIDTLPSPQIFTLTTSATSEEIKTALTDVLGDKTPITGKQLDDCLKYGYYLLDSTMRNPVFVGWNGQGYTLTSVGLPSPKGDATISTVTIKISDDNYSIIRDGSRSTILTNDNIAENDTIKDLLSQITALTERISALEEKVSQMQQG